MVSRDRGQLLLVAGIMVGLVVVATAVLLNVVVVPGDATAEGGTAAADEITVAFEPMQSDLAKLFEYATAVDAHGEPLPYARPDDLAAETAAYGSLASNLSATRSGALLNVSYVDSESVAGSAAVQWGNSAPIETSDSQNYVVEDAASVPSIWLNVTNTVNSANPLRVRVTGDGGSGDEWELLVYETRVEAHRPDGTTVTCNRSSGWPTRVYLSKHVLDAVDDDERCPRIQVSEGLEAPYDVRFLPGPQFSGEFVVTASDSAVVHSPAGGTVRSNVVLNPTFRVRYLASDITYESTFAVYNETGR
ncbi:hypothetical protein ACKVMT_01560 [Halobacteriales archaeon Cl-PHB]